MRYGSRRSQHHPAPELAGPVRPGHVPQRGGERLHRPDTACTNIDWPGYRTTAWHQRSGDGPDIRTWFGGLVDDLRDASGQMYRRNRYYDPQTGQLTQADPIGLAGGLNAYGFAAGDPVSYMDPYGLCAWGFGRDAALGNCSSSDQRHAPQGEIPRRLTSQQRQQVEAAIANLSGTAHTRLSRMLSRGQIMTLSRTALGRAADVDITPGGFGTRYRIMLQRDNQEESAFFTYGAYDASWIIAHEYGHVEQWRNGALLHIRGVPGNVRTFFFEELDSPKYRVLQRDANLFACASVVSAPPIFHSICANGGYSPP